MDFVLISDIILLLLILYLYSREYFYAKREFKCLRCGDCCRLTVRIYKEDEEKIKKEGYKNFLDEKGFLKKINGHCMFLGMKKGIAECEIENIKPKVCINFPDRKGLLGKKRSHHCRTCTAK